MSKGKLLALPTDIKYLTVTNALAYFDTELIKSVKRFIVPAHGPN